MTRLDDVPPKNSEFKYSTTIIIQKGFQTNLIALINLSLTFVYGATKDREIHTHTQTHSPIGLSIPYIAVRWLLQVSDVTNETRRGNKKTQSGTRVEG